MRRAPIVLASTVAGLAGVLSFQPREPTFTGSATPSTVEPVQATTPADAGVTPSGASGSGSSSAAGSTDAAGTAGTVADQVVTGDAIATQYGNAQVRVTISGGQITKVEALQLQANEPKSVQISTGAEPALQQSALTKQSGDIDAVSGATITSASYEASLQSALDQAGFEAADGSRGSSEIPQVEEHHDGPFGGFR